MKILNRNILKIIAVVTMLIDHIGAILFPNILVLKIIGRLSFPIFAFFIAEGYYYTKSKKKYLALLIIFAIITEPIYCYAFNVFRLNILFTFIFSIILIYLIENINKDKLLYTFYTILFFIFLLMLFLLGVIEYGIVGVILPLIFYFFKDSNLKYFIAILSLCFLTMFSINYQIFSLLSILILYFYNGNKGKYNLKYIFYIFYPAHILLLYIIKLLIF